VGPFFDEHDVKLCRMLTDRGTEFCGTSQAHEYELYLAVEDIDHSRTQGEKPANQRHLRALPQNRPAGVLSGGVPQTHLHQPRAVAG
jgi:hypothetical protein